MIIKSEHLEGGPKSISSSRPPWVQGQPESLKQKHHLNSYALLGYCLLLSQEAVPGGQMEMSVIFHVFLG